MKQFILFLVMTLPTAIAAQELHTFSNGEVADAEKINENFSNLVSSADFEALKEKVRLIRLDASRAFVYSRDYNNYPQSQLKGQYRVLHNNTALYHKYDEPNDRFVQKISTLNSFDTVSLDGAGNFTYSPTTTEYELEMQANLSSFTDEAQTIVGFYELEGTKVTFRSGTNILFEGEVSPSGDVLVLSENKIVADEDGGSTSEMAFIVAIRQNEKPVVDPLGEGVVPNNIQLDTCDPTFSVACQAGIEYYIDVNCNSFSCTPNLAEVISDPDGDLMNFYNGVFVKSDRSLNVSTIKFAVDPYGNVVVKDCDPPSNQWTVGVGDGKIGRRLNVLVRVTFDGGECVLNSS